MKGVCVLNLMTKAKMDLDDVFKRMHLPIDIMLSKTMPAGNGGTGESKNGDRIVSTVGISGLGDGGVPDGRAVEPIVALFHEACGHGMQQAYEYDKKTVLSKVLAVNYLACRGSEAYYGSSDIYASRRYFKQPYEIAAQYMGIKCAYKWLSMEFDKDEAERLIMSYEAYRQNIGRSWLPDGYDPKSVKDVLKGLNKAFQSSVHAVREYDPSKGETGHDSVHEFAECNKDKPLGSKIVSLVTECSDGLLQDMRVGWATVWANHRPKDPFYKNVFCRPAMKAAGLDPKNAKPFREDAKPFHTFFKPVSLNMMRLKDITAKIDREHRAGDGDGLDGPK